MIAADMAILCAYVLAVVRLRRLEHDAAKVEPVIAAPTSGYLMPHPVIALLSKQTILMSKLAAARALTPLTRDRVARIPPEQGRGAALDDVRALLATGVGPLLTDAHVTEQLQNA